MDSPAADDPMADETGVEDAEITNGSDSFCRSDVLRWMEVAKEMEDGATMVPPVYMILHTDLLEAGWGWTRLVPYIPGYVEWPEFKKYLGDYFNHNPGAALCAEQKPGPFGRVAAEKNALNAAANLCLKKENMLLRNCLGFLTPDDKRLILQIKDHAMQMIQSEGDQSLAVTVCLECIAKEAELMFNFLPCDFDTTKEVAICNKIRRSALNLMLYKGSESAAAAGAMVGITTEAKFILDLLSREDHVMFLEFLTCEKIRECTASVLTQLEKEFACETAAANNTSARPMGFVLISKKPLQYGRGEVVQKDMHELADSAGAIITCLEGKVKTVASLASEGLDKIYQGVALTQDEMKTILEGIRESAYGE